MVLIAAMVPLGALGGCGAKAGPTLPIHQAVAGLKIEPADHHVGKVFASSPDHKITLETRLSNESAAPIRLLEVRKSCNCTSVELGATTIRAGGTTMMKSTFAIGSRPGPNRVQVELITDANDSPSRTGRVRLGRRDAVVRRGVDLRFRPVGTEPTGRTSRHADGSRAGPLARIADSSPIRTSARSAPRPNSSGSPKPPDTRPTSTNRPPNVVSAPCSSRSAPAETPATIIKASP